MTTGLCMKTPTWDRPSVEALTGVGVYKLALPLIWFMTGSKANAKAEEGLGLAQKLESVALPTLESRLRSRPRQ